MFHVSDKQIIIGVLEKTKSHINTPMKWTKKKLINKGKFCLVGALYASCDDIAQPYYALRVTINMLIRAEWSQEIDVSEYNDNLWTTHDDIMELIDITIELLKR